MTTREAIGLPVVLLESTRIAEGVKLLRLTAAHGGRLPRWEPGAHIDLILPSGLIRQYSLCGDPDNDAVYEIAVLLEPAGRGGSQEVHTTLHAGSALTVRAPRNNFRLADAESYIFVAGGIGITPLLPMIRTVRSRGKPWTLIYGGRTRGSMAFLEELSSYSPLVQVLPQDEHGLLDLKTLVRPKSGTLIYCCGPEPLLNAVSGLEGPSWEPGCLHFERFKPLPMPASAGIGAFDVQLGLDGPVVPVPADQTILEAVLAAGCDAMFSCEEGTCGSCETRVLAGQPEHRDALLTDEERRAGAILICVSRSASRRLVLDLPPPKG